MVPAPPITRRNRGPRVKKLQREVKETLANRGFKPWAEGIIVDGIPGPMTFKMAAHAASMQGLSARAIKRIKAGRINRHDELILTHERKRTRGMKTREKRRADTWAKVRRHLLHPPDDPDGVSNFDGKLVPAWMVGRAPGPNGSRVNWLEKIRATGIWHGVIVSGYRTPEYSEGLCIAMCGAPSCSGRCAGRSTNHAKKVYPGGALDVSDYVNFGIAARKVGAPLVNALGAADPVHFSPSGH